MERKSSYEGPSRESSLYRIFIEDSTDDYTKANCKILLINQFERLKSEKQSRRLTNANGFFLESFSIQISYRLDKATTIKCLISGKININLSWPALIESFYRWNAFLTTKFRCKALDEKNFNRFNHTKVAWWYSRKKDPFLNANLYDTQLVLASLTMLGNIREKYSWRYNH